MKNSNTPNCSCQNTANVPHEACKVCAGTGFAGRGTEKGASQSELDRRFYGNEMMNAFTRQTR